jgi:hypothetical protein
MVLLQKKTIFSILIVFELAWLTLGCQAVPEFTSFSLEGTPVTAKKWPHSTFVPLRENVQVGVGEELRLESHHMSPDRLDKLEIFVDDEPVIVEASSEEGAIFSYKSNTIQIFVDAPPIGQTNSVQPKLSTSAWTVSMIWIADLPGTYDLSLRATDKLQRQGDLITQRIEVK